MLLNIIRDKILFILGRYFYNSSEAFFSFKLAFTRSPSLALPPLDFLKSLTPPPLPLGSLKPLTPPPVVVIVLLELIKKKKDPRGLNIVEVLAIVFYIKARTKNIKLFLLIINNIYSIAKKSTTNKY